MQEFEITMTKVNGSLGFTLRKDEAEERCHIVRALVKEPALSDGRIKPGDQIISVSTYTKPTEARFSVFLFNVIIMTGYWNELRSRSCTVRYCWNAVISTCVPTDYYQNIFKLLMECDDSGTFHRQSHYNATLSSSIGTYLV